jgi:hypothetical protein
VLLVGCSDDPAPVVTGNAGSATGGNTTAGTTGVAGSATTAGTSAGGNAGTAGTTGVAGSAGHAGSASGGNAGTAGGGGTAGSAGNSTEGGAGGAGGEGGASEEPTLLYDFETDVEGWAGDTVDVVVSSDATQFVTGAKSLKFVIPALAASTTHTVAVAKPLLWPGTKVVFHVWVPAGTDTLWVQAYSQVNNWKTWNTEGNAPTTLVRGGWTTITYTVPQIFPGGLQSLGIQVGAGDSAFPGGDFYLDSVTIQGGVEECAGAGTGEYGFETADITPWEVDGNPASPAEADTALAQATTPVKAGTGSLEVAFTALAAGTPEAPAARRVFAYGPSAYCTDEVTLNVWAPAGSEAVTFQAFTQSDNYDTWNAALVPATITRDGWTELKVTVPADVGPGGLQRVGVQFLNTGAAYTGDFYIDGVSW